MTTKQHHVALLILCLLVFVACDNLDKSEATASTANNATNNATNNMTATNNGTNNTTGPSAKCTQYCDLMDANCATNYADRAACETACAGLAEDAALDCTAPGDCAGAADGVECRIYHGDVAAGDAATHCPHAAEDGGGVCG